MKLKVLGSSSDGNGYILEGDNEALLLEAGVSFRKTRRLVNLDKVVGLLVTHRHGDHAKHIKDYVACGIPCVAPQSVWDAKRLYSANTYSCPSYYEPFQLGGFTIRTIHANHDVPTVGYIISHEELGNLLFLTDSRDMTDEEGQPIVINGLNHVMIECNYSFMHLEEAIREGRTKLFQKERIMNTHMEVETCINSIRSCGLENVSEIVLLHLSSNNAKEDYCKGEVVRATGRDVYVAKEGIEIELINENRNGNAAC